MQNIQTPTTLQEKLEKTKQQQESELRQSAKIIAEQEFKNFTKNWNELLNTKLSFIENDTKETLKSMQSEINAELNKTISKIYSHIQSNQIIISWKWILALTALPASIIALIGMIAFWILAEKLPSQWETGTSKNGEKLIFIPQTSYQGQTADKKLIFKGN